jgi:hypothetical protein
MKYFTIILLVFSFVIAGCSSHEKLANYKDVEISFGNGGGYTGQEIVYTIHSDGKVFMTDNLKKETTELPKLKSKKTLELFEQLTDLNIGKIDFNHPGNMYSFIQETKEGKSHKVVWGDGREKPSEAVLDFYQVLNSSVNK